MNPVAFAPDDFENRLKEDETVNEQEKERLLEMAALMNSSQLLKSYELLIQQYEQDFELKNGRIRDMERELQQIHYENSNMAQQLYTLKSQAIKPSDEQSSIEARILGGTTLKDERDQLVELLKRNHDIVCEKFEVQRQRNETLEKVAVEKERLYNEIKIDND